MEVEQISEPITIIRPSKGWGILDLKEVWEYRDLILLMFWRNLKGGYQQMALGMLWIVLSPLLSLVMNTIVFGLIANMPSDGIPYPLFNYAALLPWTLFVGVLNATSGSLIGYVGLMSKVYFPRLIIPIIGVLNSLFNFGVSFFILLVMMRIYGFIPPWTIVFIPLYLVVAVVTGLTIGLWFAPWVVRYRDVSKVTGYMSALWMYATPVVYALSAIPETLLPIYRLNPMTSVVEGFRWALLQNGQILNTYFLLSFLLVIPFFIGGLFYYHHAARSIVDIA